MMQENELILFAILFNISFRISKSYALVELANKKIRGFSVYTVIECSERNGTAVNEKDIYS